MIARDIMNTDFQTVSPTDSIAGMTAFCDLEDL